MNRKKAKEPYLRLGLLAVVTAEETLSVVTAERQSKVKVDLWKMDRVQHLSQNTLLSLFSLQGEAGD